jgi:hypothetical protein
LIWLRIGTGGRLFWMRSRISWFHNMWGISWQSEDLLASEERLTLWSSLVSWRCIWRNTASTGFRTGRIGFDAGSLLYTAVGYIKTWNL